ncbi:MAG: hypothetical protein HC869_16555, partial [Rhodospirillales bacterium]|nr:hypothetical protein [Rhodospirillales bacterium]
MAKRLLSSDRLVALGSAIGAAYIRLAFNTSKVRRDPPDTDTKLFAEHPQIFAMWMGSSACCRRSSRSGLPTSPPWWRGTAT